jgi:hypothetical protein
MKAVRRAIKVSQDEDTNQINASRCAFLWEDVVGMEDETGTRYDYPKPRTWIWLTYSAFYIEGELEDVFAEWVAYQATFESALSFSRH